MGGSLLKTWDLPEKRISRDEYFLINSEIIKIFKKYYPICKFQAPRVTFSKSSFGDSDLICNLQGEQVLKVIKENFWNKPHCNAGVYSFPYKGFQIDIGKSGFYRQKKVKWSKKL